MDDWFIRFLYAGVRAGYITDVLSIFQDIKRHEIPGRSLDEDPDAWIEFLHQITRLEPDTVRELLFSIGLPISGRPAPSDSPNAVPETLTLVGNETAPIAHDVLAQPKIPPYQIEGELGSGGMGVVYKAYDPRLEREVALKILRVSDEESLKRFLREARAQARLDHPNVVKVYEVGEHQGLYYIAMQYVPGRTLGELAPTLNLEEKIHLMIQVAEALHDAHAHGLVHRDIKPSNIMVMFTETGERRPYLMDFGLARELAASHLTATGVVVGTPQYMAPEQARGEIHRIDRRTDVYSMGATLYEVVTGTPPFEGESSLTVLMQVLDREPPSPRQRRPDLPADLETIIMKCLEKDPARRYPTARALAEDLRRFLDGDPIQARPPSLTYRMKKIVYKHRVLATVIALAIVMVLGIGSWALWSRWRLNRQAEFAREFARAVGRIETRALLSYMMPPHDIRRDRREILAMLDRVRRRAETAGSLARGPAELAIGLGYMDLREWEKARDHLEQARSLGYDTDEVRLALGKVYASLYRDGLRRIEKIRNRKARNLERQLLIRKYRFPALRLLQSISLVSQENPALIQSLMALIDGRTEQSIKFARQAREREPWRYESWLLEADARVLEGDRAFQKGDYPMARRFYQNAAHAYQMARAIGSSDPQVDIGDCTRLAQLVRIEIYLGHDPGPLIQKALKVCDRALQLNPDLARPYTIKSVILNRYSQYQYYKGRDPRSSWKQAIAWAQEAIKRDPKDVDAYNNLGTSYAQLGDYLNEIGEDPRPALARAMDAYQKVLRQKPTAVLTWNNLAITYNIRLRYALEHGEPIEPWAGKADQAFRESIRLQPDNWIPWNNLGTLWSDVADYRTRHLQDPTDAFHRSLEAYEKCLALNPGDAYAHSNTIYLLNAMIWWQMVSGTNPEMTIQRAIEHFEKAIAANPKHSFIYSNAAETYLFQALHRETMGTNAAESLKRAESMFKQALELNPKLDTGWQGLASVAMKRAIWASSMKARMDALKRAERLAKRVLDIVPESRSAILTRIQLAIHRAELSSNRVAARKALARADAWLKNLEKKHADEFDIRSMRVRWRLSRALLARRLGEDVDWASVIAAAQKLREIYPHRSLAGWILGLVYEAYYRATGQGRDAMLEAYQTARKQSRWVDALMAEYRVLAWGGKRPALPAP